MSTHNSIDDTDTNKGTDAATVSSDTNEPSNDDDIVFEEEETSATIKRLRERLNIVTKEKQEYLDGWQRAKADLVNVKREHEDTRARMMHMGKSAMIEDLLSVADSFDMAFGNEEAWEKVDKEWRTGVEYIYAQFKRVLDDHGIETLNPKHERFDPEKHEAVEMVPVDTSDKDGMVQEVSSKGYLFDGKVLRAARVKVGEYTG